MNITSGLALPFDHYSTDSGDERWLADVIVNLSVYGEARFIASLNAAIRAENGAKPIFRVRMGGTPQQTDGTQILRVAPSTSPVDWTVYLLRTATAIDIGPALFKLTGQSSAGDAAEISAATLALWFGDVSEAPETPATGEFLMSKTGDDIWLDQVSEVGAAEMAVTNSGDWAPVSGRLAVQQSLIRRFLTKPGDYLVDPTYGAGLLAAVKKRMRESDLAAIASRLRAQALREPRVRAVTAISVESLSGTANGLKYTITVDLVGDGRPMTFGQEVS